MAITVERKYICPSCAGSGCNLCAYRGEVREAIRHHYDSENRLWWPEDGGYGPLGEDEIERFENNLEPLS